MIKTDNNNNIYMMNCEAVSKRCSSSLKNGKILSVLFVGVGGQGIILATAVLAHAAINAGFDVKVSEVHGMAQRGGSVEGSVRLGKKVFSPTISSADLIVALERLEAARYIERLSPGGVLLVNDYEIYPSSGFAQKQCHAPDAGKLLSEATGNFLFINAVEIARKLGRIKVSNIVLTGVLSRFLPFEDDCWMEAVKKNVPKKAININVKAFISGREFFNK